LTSNGSGVGTWVLPVTETKRIWQYKLPIDKFNTNQPVVTITDLVSQDIPENI